MNARRLALVLAVLTAAVVVTAAVLHFRSSKHAARHEALVEMTRDASAEQNESDATVFENTFLAALRPVAMRSESTSRGTALALAFEGEAPLGRIREVIDTNARALPPAWKSAAVTARPEGEAQWVVAPVDLSSTLPRASVCGSPRPDRLRVRFDAAKLAALGLDLADVPLATLPAEREQLLAWPIGTSRLADVASVTTEKHPPACAAWSGETKAVVVHVIRGAQTKVAVPPGGAVYAEPELALARFVVMGGNTAESRRRLAADLAGRAKAQGLPIVAALVNVDGVGTLVFRRPVDEVIARSVVRTALNDGWGGFHAAPHLFVTVRRPEEVEKRAAEIARRVDALEGVGLRLAIAPPLEPVQICDVDDELAQTEKLDRAVLQAIFGAWKGDEDAHVLLDLPSFPELRIHGRPATSMFRVRTVMVRSRRVRIDQVPAIELAWENGNADVAGRVRQALGASSDVDVRVGAGFSDLSAF